MINFWNKILPNYWETFWYEQLQWAINWCWHSPQKQKFDLVQYINRIEQEIWDSSMNDDYYPQAA